MVGLWGLEPQKVWCLKPVDVPFSVNSQPHKLRAGRYSSYLGITVAEHRLKVSVRLSRSPPACLFEPRAGPPLTLADGNASGFHAAAKFFTDRTLLRFRNAYVGIYAPVPRDFSSQHQGDADVCHAPSVSRPVKALASTPL